VIFKQNGFYRHRFFFVGDRFPANAAWHAVEQMPAFGIKL
jgi:hypothetical protein